MIRVGRWSLYAQRTYGPCLGIQRDDDRAGVTLDVSPGAVWDDGIERTLLGAGVTTPHDEARRRAQVRVYGLLLYVWWRFSLTVWWYGDCEDWD
jgi:hypothetical protein